MMHIPDPFKTDIDEPGYTLSSDVPKSSWKNMKDHAAANAQFDRDPKEGIAELSRNPDIESFILKEINLSVSQYDNHIVKSVLHTGVSAYATPLNVSLRDVSGAGKTYDTTETIKFLPPEDVLFIGSQSPKVISHENGVR